MSNTKSVGVAYSDPVFTEVSLPASGLKIGTAGSETAVTTTAAELNVNAGVVAGTVSASKTLVVDANSRLASMGSITFKVGEGLGVAGAFTAVSPRNIATGNAPAITTTQGTDTSTNATTEVYWAEVHVPANVSSTGGSWLNGSAVAGNFQGYLYDSNGAFVAKTASTGQASTNAYQQAAWAGGAVALKGPATYYIGWSGDTVGGTQKYRSHLLGNFGSNKVTAQVYGTQPATAVGNAPTTFVASLGPIASLY